MRHKEILTKIRKNFLAYAQNIIEEANGKKQEFSLSELQHIQFSVNLVAFIVNFYKEIGDEEALALDEEAITLLQLIAVCYYAKKDEFENFCVHILEKLGLTDEILTQFTPKKGLIGKIFQSMDRLDNIHFPAPNAPDLDNSKNDDPNFCIKSIRWDQFNYFRNFSKMIIAPFEKFPLRPFPKKLFTVKGDGVYRRFGKEPQYSLEQKRGYSQPQSVSLVTEQTLPLAFGFSKDQRVQKLVGVAIARKDALLARQFLYDGGTTNRPYDRENFDQALEYFIFHQKILFADEEEFKKTIAKPINSKRYNEVLARLRWNTDGSSFIIISSDSFNARLIGQEYARILQNQLKLADPSHNQNYRVPIYFYLPDSRQHMQEYPLNTQLEDRKKAQKIYEDQERRKFQYKEGDYEILLGIDDVPIAEILSEKLWNGEILISRILNAGLVHIVQSLLEKDQKALAAINIDAASVSEGLVHVCRVGDVNLAKWLLIQGVAIKDEALLIAIEKGHSEIVKLLIQHHANLRIYYDKENSSKLLNLLQYAADMGHAEIVKLLLAEGLNINAKTLTCRQPALHLAARNGHTEVVKVLLAAGANSLARNNIWQRKSAFELAVRFEHVACSQLMLNLVKDKPAKEKMLLLLNNKKKELAQEKKAVNLQYKKSKIRLSKFSDTKARENHLKELEKKLTHSGKKAMFWKNNRGVTASIGVFPFFVVGLFLFIFLPIGPFGLIPLGCGIVLAAAYAITTLFIMPRLTMKNYQNTVMELTYATDVSQHLDNPHIDNHQNFKTSNKKHQAYLDDCISTLQPQKEVKPERAAKRLSFFVDADNTQGKQEADPDIESNSESTQLLT